jgi:hypothetical protein
LFTAAFTRPDQLSGLKILNVGKILVAFSSGNFINTDMGNATKISIFQTVLDNKINGRGHGSPSTVKKSSNLYPGQKSGPSGQITGKGICKSTLSGCPRYLFNVNATAVLAYYTAR